MRIFDFFREVYRRLFPIKDIQTALGVEPALSQNMLDRIAVWNKAYMGKAAHVDGDKVISLRLESSSVRELANVTLSEMTTNVSNKQLNDLLEKVKVNLNKNLQRGLATGGMVIKPLNESGLQFVAANAFIPLAYDAEGRLTDVVFPEQKRIGGKYYTRLERHTLSGGTLTIVNSAYESDSENALGRPVPLSAVDEWKNYRESATFPVSRNIYGYFRTPNDNTVDGSAAGVSVFETAMGKIRRADIQFGRLDFEFESAKRRIHADVSMVKKTESGYELDEVYVDVNGDSDDFYKEFSPSLRQDGFIAGLEEYKREIEFDIGLSYGDLSQPQYVEKTATEVNAAKIRKRNTVAQIQEQLRACLDDLVFALAFHNRLTKSGYEFTCDFKDSILNDEQSEREEDRKDLANGTLRPEEYRARWRNETLAKAKENLPQQAEVD